MYLVRYKIVIDGDNDIYSLIYDIYILRHYSSNPFIRY